MVRRTAPPPDPPKMNPPKPAASAPAPKAAPQAHPKPAPEPAAGSTSTASPQQAMEPAVEPMKDPHERKLGDGKQHGMKPVDFPHPDKIHTFSDLTKAMGGTTAGARDLGKAVDVVKAMMADKDCTVVLTLSGNATPFTTLIAELIDRKIVHAVVSTGSICTHSFSAERGRPMFKIEDPDAIDDSWFYNRGYNRIYDVVELETSLNEGYEALSDLTSKMMAERNVGSADVTKAVGDYLNEKFPKVNGLLHAAARAGVPIFIPAFSDCELGLDFHAQNLERRDAGRQEVAYSAFKDWEQYCRLIKGAKTVGILELGGGVPRNWAQQVGPFYDILTEKKLEPKSLIIRIKYAVRICSAPGTEGGLSGCGFSEGRSWGKFLAEDAGGMNAEIVGDYTLAFPLLCQAILEATVE